MVSSTSPVSNALTDSITLNATPAAGGTSSTDSTNSFTDQLLSALDSFLGQAGNGSQIQITLQPEQGQNSGASQYLVTLTAPSTATNTSAETAASASTAAASGSSNTPASSVTPAVSQNLATPAAALTTTYEGMPITTLQDQIQQMEDSWAVLTPQQVAFQLANAAGTGGGPAAATVPGTTLTFGDLTQTQQLAYQYASAYGTGGASMQDFLTQNAGPDLPWNLSYNEIQSNPDIMAAADPTSQTQSGTASSAEQPANTFGSGSAATTLNADNLPNPALIQFLPADQQAAAEAAVAAEGAYGTNITGGIQAYQQALQSV
jgi:hypothetical protein